ncbi:MAG TPA: flagellar FlbD family protein [Symbiobacteriaceae bacterium]|jgi:flagellar protein FlbD|nr:flagellar FlbD family protein [Symbiobacteriaceae bacterium]
MIKVSRLRATQPELVVNAELIETVEATPDTVITLTTGHKVIVQESVDEVIRLVVAYKRLIHQPEGR